MQQRPWLDLLCVDELITQHVSRAQWVATGDPALCLGQSGVMVDRLLAQADPPEGHGNTRLAPFPRPGTHWGALRRRARAGA